MPTNSAPPLFEALQGHFGAAKVTGRQDLNGRECVLLSPAAWVEVISHLRLEHGFDVLMELAGADYSGYPGHQGDPLCVTAMLYGSKSRERAWLKVFLPLEQPQVGTLSNDYAGANWYERECFDMYGVQFQGHHYLKRLLLYDEFVGHQLRKDYPILKMQPLIPMRNAIDYEAVAAEKRRSTTPAQQDAARRSDLPQGGN
jgi:NADH-quinone oxidoreductase subunit C